LQRLIVVGEMLATNMLPLNTVRFFSFCSVLIIN